MQKMKAARSSKTYQVIKIHVHGAMSYNVNILAVDN